MDENFNDDYQINDFENLSEKDERYLNKDINEEYKAVESKHINSLIDNTLNNPFDLTKYNDAEIIRIKLELSKRSFLAHEKNIDADSVNIINLHRKIKEKSDEYEDIYKTNTDALLADIAKELRSIHRIELCAEGLFQPIQMLLGKKLRILKEKNSKPGEFERIIKKLQTELNFDISAISIHNYILISKLLDYNLPYDYYASRICVLYGISDLYEKKILDRKLQDPILSVFLSWGYNGNIRNINPIRICEYVDFKYNKLTNFNFDSKVYFDLYNMNVPLNNSDYRFLINTAKCSYIGNIKIIDDPDYANDYFRALLRNKGNKKTVREKLKQEKNSFVSTSQDDKRNTKNKENSQIEDIGQIIVTFNKKLSEHIENNTSINTKVLEELNELELTIKKLRFVNKEVQK